MLKREPPRPAVKGGREKNLNDKSKENEKPVANNKINSISNSKDSGSDSGESGNDSDAENKPTTPAVNISIKRPNSAPSSVEVSTNRTVSSTNPLRPSSLINHENPEQSKDNKTETPSSVSRFARYNKKEPEKEEPKKEEPPFPHSNHYFN